MTSKPYKNAVCRGSWALGTACGKCERCLETKPPLNTGEAETSAGMEKVRESVQLWFGGGDPEQAKHWDRETDDLMQSLAPDLAALTSTRPAGEEVERMTAWLYAREGGVAFHLLSEADQEQWRAQARDAIAALQQEPKQ